jgi:hypothetical protein
MESRDPGAPRRPRSIVTVAEYDGQAEVRVRATELGTNYTAAAARRVVDDWVAFFSDGPSPIERLELTTRTPRRLFESLGGQRQLRSLRVAGGDYSDLAPLRGMSELTELELRGAGHVTDVEAVSGLTNLRWLALEGFRQLDEPSPLGEPTLLTDLELGGDWRASRNAHLPTIAFLRHLPNLSDLLLHTLVVDDKDYSPLLELPRLQRVRVMAVRGMTPSLEELKAALPWNG